MNADAVEPALFVDLDGTLIHGDLSWESLASALRLHPGRALKSLTGGAPGRAALKRALAESSMVDAGNLPYRGGFLQWLQGEAARGRRIYLATANDRLLAERVARYLGLFVGVIASDGEHDRKGSRKLEAIRQIIGDEPFDYCGSDRDDLPLFAAARKSIIVGASPEALRNAQALGNVQRVFPDRPRTLGVWWQALRPMQWFKNALVFVPLLTLLRVGDGGSIAAAWWTACAFSLAASAGYLFNDVLDLQADRRHPRRRLRSLATGAITVPAALVASIVLGFGALALAAWAQPQAALWLLGYLLLSGAYSLLFKRLAMVDVVVLALGLGMRVMAGAAAIAMPLPFWLITFAAFLFLSMALLRPCAELAALRDRHDDLVRGRGYRVADLAVLQPLGLACAVAAIVIFAMFVRTPEVQLRFAHPGWLWVTIVALFAWLGRVWLVANRGSGFDDPLITMLRSHVGQILWLLMLGGYAAAIIHRSPA